MCSKQQSTVPARSGQPLYLHHHVDSQAQQHHNATGVDRDTHQHILRDLTPRQRKIRETFSTSTEDGEAALGLLTRQQLDVQVGNGRLVRGWYGVHAAAEPNLLGRLAALDVFMGRRAVACMGAAGELYGFDVQNTTSVDVLDPGVRMGAETGLTVHQRTGAPRRSEAACDGAGMDRGGNCARSAATAGTGNLRRPAALTVLRAGRTSAGGARAAGPARHRWGARAAALRRPQSGVGDGKRGVAGDDRPRSAAPCASARDPRPQRPVVAGRLRVAGRACRRGIRQRRLACGSRCDAAGQAQVGENPRAGLDAHPDRGPRRSGGVPLAWRNGSPPSFTGPADDGEQTPNHIASAACVRLGVCSPTRLAGEQAKEIG